MTADLPQGDGEEVQPLEADRLIRGHQHPAPLVELDQVVLGADGGLGELRARTLASPLGATLLRTSAMPADTLIGLDRNYALEMVSAGDVGVEYDKLIDRQVERAAITSISGSDGAGVPPPRTARRFRPFAGSPRPR